MTLKCTAKARDLYEAETHMLEEFSLSTVNIFSLAMDSVPAVEDKTQEFVKLMQDNEIASSNLCLMECQCIAHQQFLCADL